MPRPEARSEHRWGVILAAGQGTRLASVTTMLHGHPVPKQFATLLGDRSLLQATLDRLAGLIPAARTVVVVDAGHAPLAEEQLARYPGVRLVLQPRDRGTAAGLLLPLAEVLARDAQARVLVLPSDHVFAEDERFHQVSEDAWQAAERVPAGVALIGAPATVPAVDLGWIRPGDACGREPADGYRVKGFVEKPDPDLAQSLLEGGALWSTMILAGRGEALWTLVSRRLSGMAARLSCYRFAIDRPEAPQILEDAYANLSASDLSRDVLEKASGLAVVRLPDAVWTDCGTPQRLLRVIGSQELRRRTSPLGELRGALVGGFARSGDD